MDKEVDAPRWDISAHSSITEQVISEFKFKLKYEGFFWLARNSCRQVYLFGSTKCLYIDTFSYDLNHLVEEVKKTLSVTKRYCFSFTVMLNMYNEDKEVTIYTTTEKLSYNPKPLSCQDKVIDESDDENEMESVCPSQESYHSLHRSYNEYELLNYGETYAYSMMNPFMKVNSKFPSVIAFRRALNHYALTNEFEYVIEKSDLTRIAAYCGDKKCKWRIHASITQDGVTFEKLILVLEEKRVIADVVTDKLKFEGDVSHADLNKWLMHTYNVEIPYMRVFRGREQAYTSMYGKWDDSYTVGEKKHFLCFFISLTTCSKGFLASCRPYIGLVACHLKGEFNGVLDAATSIEGNNGMFPVAYGVIETENTKSWNWFIIKLWEAANTFCVSKHDRLLNEIATKCENAISYLNKNHKKICSRSDIRYKPVLDLVDAIREKLMERFDKKMKGEKMERTISSKRKENLGEYQVCRISDNKAKVKFKGYRWDVVLDEKKMPSMCACSCFYCFHEGA
uniref:Transposase MuDR plant domain-containing protein n=1 Tax=Lactuca sativa TaxID=4236 RepID=A0A9R1V250_LACSA|nr:hypothetical protein LSAT_V11C700366300 [Lactuca sativa]